MNPFLFQGPSSLGGVPGETRRGSGMEGDIAGSTVDDFHCGPWWIWAIEPRFMGSRCSRSKRKVNQKKDWAHPGPQFSFQA